MIKQRDNLSSITNSPFLNDKSCLGFSNLFENLANDLANIRNQRLRDPNTLIIGNLDINSFQNKYEMFAGLTENFPDKQFHYKRFKIFRYDRNRYGGDLKYVHERIPYMPLKNSTLSNHWFRISSNKTEMAFCRKIQAACS